MSDRPQNATPEPVEDDLPEQMRVRREKRERLIESGQEAYPVHVDRTHTLAEIRATYDDAGLEPDTRTGEQVAVSGRVMFLRNTGKLCFVRLREGDGTELQVMLSLADVGEEALAGFKSLVDLGDLLAVRGEVVTSRRGELSVQASAWSMAAKTLRPLPNEYKPLSEEARVRLRFVDMMLRPEPRDMVRAKAAVLKSLRSTLDSRGYVEVETPILQLTNGGAAARPFRTHLNALDQEMLLRIALELDLKKAMIGGVDRVYEIGRTFRNEGLDSTHAAEFSMLEAYEAYGDINTMKDLVRSLVLDSARALGRTVVPARDGSEIDLEQDWQSASIMDLVSDKLGEQVDADTPLETLKKYAERHEVELQPHWNSWRGRARALRAARRGDPDPADLRRGLPRVGPAAGQAAPHEERSGRGVRPDRQRRGAVAGVLRAQRPGHPEATARRAVAARGAGRPGGDGARRGVPQGHGVRHAAGRGHGDGRGPAADAAHGREHPRDDPFPAAAPRIGLQMRRKTRGR